MILEVKIMNFKKNFSILIILFILIFSVGVVSASENSDNLTVEETDSVDSASVYQKEEIDLTNISQIENADVLKTTDDDEIVVNNWEELQYYCSLDDKDYTLRLKENTNFYPNLNYTQQIIINNNVKIIGSESSWIGDSRYNPWTIKDGNVYGDYIRYTPIIVPDDNGKGLTLENVTFKWINTVYNPDAVFLRMGGNGKYVIKNCVFKEISTLLGHSSIVWLKKGDGLIENCTFVNCTTDFGCVSVFTSKTIYDRARMVVKDCCFENNYARTEPGCINNCGILTVYNTTFVKNKSFWWAGAIHTHYYSNTTIYDSNFTDNVAGWNGGALYTYGVLNIYNTVFIGNNCTTNSGGGAIGGCYFESAPHIYIKNSLFENNVNNYFEGTGGAGGAIAIMDTGFFEVYDTTFISNSATHGTAISVIADRSYGSPDVVIVNNTFINHTRMGDVLFVYVNGTGANVSNNNYYGNSIVFSNLTLTSVDIGSECATLEVTAILSNPQYYDLDILNKTLYDVYINDKYFKTVNSTIFDLEFDDLDICNVYVIPTISNRKTNDLTLISTREYIFVSKNNGNDTNDGLSRDTPVNTIKKALELAKNCQNIILLDGQYNEKVEINYDVTIKGEGNATLTNDFSFNIEMNNLTLKNMNINNLSGSLFINQSNGNLIIENCIFRDNSLDHIFVTNSLEISKSLFENNNAIIVNNQGIVSIKNSILLNNSGIIEGNPNYNLDFNWWGSTLNNFSKPVNLNINNWLVLNATSSVRVLEQNQNALIQFAFYLFENNTSYKYDYCPEVDLVITSVNGISSVNHTSSNSMITYTLTALNDGFIIGSYNDVSFSYSFEFIKSNPNISIHSENIMVGDNLTIKISSLSDVSGNLTVSVGNFSQTKEIGKLSIFTFQNLKAGNHIIIANYSGDKKYSDNVVTSTVEVSKYESIISIELSEIEVGNDFTVTITTNNDATGNVSFYINNNRSILTLTDAKANYTINNIARGDYVFYAVYNGDDKYLSSEDSVKIEVDNLVSKMEISARDIVYGETAIVNVKLNDNATGSISATIDGIVNSSQVVNGKAKVLINGLDAGVDKDIIVFYSGDNTYFNKTEMYNFTINKADLVFNISSSNVMIGQDAIVYINVARKTTGTFTINGDVINIPIHGIVEYVISDLEIGNYTIEAIYNGNNYKTISNSTSFSVLEYPSPQWPNVGFNIENRGKSNHESNNNGEIACKISLDDEINGNLAIDSEGNIYITVSDKIYSFGKGIYKWNFTSHVVDSSFSGICISRDVIIAPKSGDTLYFINQTSGMTYDSNIYQASSLFAPIVDSNANVYIVSEYQYDINGYNLVIVPYNIWENGGNPILIDLGNYAPLTSPTVSDELIVVLCEGRLRFIDAKTLDTISIKSGSFASVRPVIGEGNIVYIALKENLVAYNSNGVQLWKTKVTGGVGNTMALDSNQALYHVNAKGLLYRYDLISGEESKVSDLKVTSNVLIGSDGTLYFGSNNLFYALDSDGNVLWKSDLESNIVGSPVMDSDGLIYITTENNKIIALTNAPLKESNLKIQVEDIVKGQTATVTVTWNSQTTGTIICNVNGEEITANADEGKITKTISGLDIGHYDIDASYDGDMRFKPTTVTKTFVVRSADDIANNIHFDGNKTFTFSLNNAKGNLTVNIGTKSYSKVLVNGKASITVDNLAPGEYEAIVTYSGDGVYNSASRTFTVSVPKFNVTLNEQITTKNIVSTVSVALPSDATGNLTLSIGTKKYTQKVTTGKATIVVDDIPAGNYSATLAYSGDSKYNGASKTVSINPTKIPVTLDHTNVFVKSGSEPVISIKLDSNASGKFVVAVDGEEYTADISEVIIISDLESGNYTGTLTYCGDKKYDKASYVISFEVLNTTPIDNTTNTTIDNGTTSDNSTNTTGDNSTVEKANPTLIVSASDVNVGETAIVNVKASFENGKVTVNVNNKDYELNINSFESSLTIQNLAIGKYNVIVMFAGDDKFNPASNSTKFNVLKVNIPVTDETITLPDSNSTSYSVNLPADATGTLTVTVDGTDYTSQLVNGKATVNIPELSEGTHNITVSYSGDSKYEAIIKSTVVNVKKTDITNTTGDNGTAVDNSTTAKSDVTIIVTAGDVNVGEDALIQVTSSEDSIKLTVLVNNKQYALGDDGTVTISNLAVGKYNVIVMFAGDDKFNSASNSTTFNVIKISVPVTDETITLPDSNSTSYSVNLPSDATGTLTVTVDGEKYTETLINGKATVNIPELSEGTHNITITYSGDTKYEAITKSGVVNVNKTDITNTTGDNSTVIDNSTNSTVADNSTNTTGDNGTAIDNTTNTTVKVNTTLNVNVEDVNVGDDAIINVKASFESGKVSVNVNGNDYQIIISNGDASVSISDLAVGNYTVLARFAGDDKLNPASNSTSFNVFKVNIPVTDETVTVPSDDSTAYSISLPSDATGTLTVAVDGVNYTETLTNGKATVNIPELKTGTHNITVTYSGDAKYSPITKSSVVTKNPVIKLTGSNLNMLYTSGKYFKVRLTADGEPLAGQTVKITINGKTYSKTTNKDGYASIKISLAPKTYSVKASYANLTITKKVVVKSIIKAKNVNAKKSAKTVKIKVTLKKVNKKYLKNKKVTLKFNKKTIKAKTNKKGVVTFTIKKSVYKKLKTNKKYTYRVIYGKDKVKKTIKFKK